MQGVEEGEEARAGRFIKEKRVEVVAERQAVHLNISRFTTIHTHSSRFRLTIINTRMTVHTLKEKDDVTRRRETDCDSEGVTEKRQHTRQWCSWR